MLICLMMLMSNNFYDINVACTIILVVKWAITWTKLLTIYGYLP